VSTEAITEVSPAVPPHLGRYTWHKPEGECDQKPAHEYKRDAAVPE